MANEPKKGAPTAGANAAPSLPAGFKVPEGLVNLNTRYPEYDGGDARVAKSGHKGYPIHGLLLGSIRLPSIQKDERGNSRPWDAYVIELLQACPVCDPGEDSETRMAPAGTRIVLTKSGALNREDFELAAIHPSQVFECFVTPEVGKNSKGQSMWLYPTLSIGKPRPRTPEHQVRFPGLDEARKLAAANGAARALPPAPEDEEPPPHIHD